MESGSGRTSRTTSSFSISDYINDTQRVVDYAAQHGTAIVKADDGRVQMVISVPTTDLPPFEPPLR